MKRSMTALLLAASLGLAACGERGADTVSNETADNSATMEGGGVYPSPSPSLAVEPMASDPAANAARNETQNMAPSAVGSGAPTSAPSGAASGPAGR